VLLEDIGSHFGIPFTLEVAKVATSLEQFFEFEFVHVVYFPFCLLNFCQSSGRPSGRVFRLSYAARSVNAAVHPGDLDTKLSISFKF
jgi:hypothetical protein